MTSKNNDGEDFFVRQCISCGDDFAITRSQAQWFREKFRDGLDPVPRRCQPCRERRRRERKIADTIGVSR